MTSEPTVDNFPERHYAGISTEATLAEWGRVNALVPEVFAWLDGRGIAPAGAPIYRYHKVDGGVISLDVGVPVGGPVESDGRVEPKTLLAGRYAVYMHRGHPDRIIESFALMDEWAHNNNVEWDITNGVWACRFESYGIDPAVQPDPAQWEVEIAYRLKGE